jgi:CHAD domain-containing protein
VGAAAAVVGAAAIAGKLAWDRRADSEREAEQAFRLYRDEAIPAGIRRVARGQLDHARAQLAESPRRKLASAVHDARKSLKRLRATVRLVRGAIGDETYRRENAAFRESGRRLSAARDASVLIEALEKLEKASGEELPREATAEFRRRLEDEREQALESLAADQAVVAAVVADIERARTRAGAWSFEAQGFEAFHPGLRRIYRRGRKAMRRAQADPTDENLHEWRKRVKDLWHAEQILRPAAPKKMKKLAKRTHRLADLLGDDHDLAQLCLSAGRHRDGFEDGASQSALIAVIAGRRDELQQYAFASGQRLYRLSPKRFIEAIERGWRTRARPPAAAAC